MAKNKKLIIYHSTKLALLTILAIVIFILNERMTQDLPYFVGSVMLLYALEEFLYQIIFERKNILKSGKSYFALMEIIIGTTLVIADIEFGVACAIWASWSILRESHEIKEAVTVRYNIVLRILNAVESIAAIVLSVMLIINPTTHHVYLHVILLVIELISTPLLLLLTDFLKGHNQHPDE